MNHLEKQIYMMEVSVYLTSLLILEYLYIFYLYIWDFFYVWSLAFLIKCRKDGEESEGGGVLIFVLFYL